MFCAPYRLCDGSIDMHIDIRICNCEEDAPNRFASWTDVVRFFIQLQPGVTVKHTKEGTESSAFWFALGGKQSYTSKKVTPEVSRDPHLFAYSINKGTYIIL